MSGEIFKEEETTENERVCITQYEQKEYDSCTWENEDFGKESISVPLNSRMRNVGHNVYLSLRSLDLNSPCFRRSFLHRAGPRGGGRHRPGRGPGEDLPGFQRELLREELPGEDHRGLQTQRRGTLRPAEPQVDQVDAQDLLSLLLRPVLPHT